VGFGLRWCHTEGEGGDDRQPAPDHGGRTGGGIGTRELSVGRRPLTHGPRATVQDGGA
jgi:hypothetical protein